MVKAFCENCGTKREANGRFCTGCGVRLEPETEFPEAATGPDQADRVADQATNDEEAKDHIYGAGDRGHIDIDKADLHDIDGETWEPEDGYPGPLSTKRAVIFVVLLLLVIVAYLFFVGNRNYGDRYDVAVSTLNCREEPTSSSEVVGQFAQGEQVVVSDRQGDWFEVAFEDENCWVSSEFLKRPLKPITIIGLDEAGQNETPVVKKEDSEFEEFEPSFRLESRLELQRNLLGEPMGWETVYILTNDGDAAARVKWVAINRRSECLAVPVLNRDGSRITSLSVLGATATAAVADFVKLEVGQSIRLVFPQKCGRLIHLEIGELGGTYEIRDIFAQ